jgi:putative tricarboxylic transport membrane protein
LGIPGDVVTAILVGALIAHGIKPGPLLFIEDIGSVYTIYIALFFAVISLFFIGKLGIPVFAKVVKLRKATLLPMIFIICVVGTYSNRSNIFDAMMMIALGALGFILKKNRFPIAPLVISFVIGAQLEMSLRQSLILSDMSIGIFFTRPLSLALIVGAVVFSFFMVRRNTKASQAAPTASPAAKEEK